MRGKCGIESNNTTISYTNNQEFNVYYIYILKNPITGLPFYVGVGKENRRSSCTREQQHINEAIKYGNGKVFKKANLHKLNTILKILNLGYQVDIEIGRKYENEQYAFNEEIRLIAYYGGRDLRTGILTNMSDGGEGCVNPSPETNKKRSDSKKGKPTGKKGIKIGPYSEERKQHIRASRQKGLADGTIIPWNKGKKGAIPWNKGIKMSEEQKKNMGADKGRQLTDSWKKNIGNSLRGKTNKNKGKTAHNKGVLSGKKV